jgi:hypothetical protein
MDIDAMLAGLAEDRRRDCTHWAQTTLANPDVVPFRQATLFLLVRLASGATVPTLREIRKLASAWARYQSALARAGKARKSA